MKPTNKVTAGVLASFLTTIIIWSLKQRGLEMDAGTAVAVSGVITFIVQWLTKDSPLVLEKEDE